MLATIFFGAVAITVVQVADLGGLDLRTYCKSHGYASNDADRRHTDIPIADACNWQYGEPGHRFVQPGGPYNFRWRVRTFVGTVASI